MTDSAAHSQNPRTGCSHRLGSPVRHFSPVSLIGSTADSACPPGDFSDLARPQALDRGLIPGGRSRPPRSSVTPPLSNPRPDLPSGLHPRSAYSYGLVPIIQPQSMRLLTSKEASHSDGSTGRYRARRRSLSRFSVLSICAILLPSATPLVSAVLIDSSGYPVGRKCAGVTNRTAKAHYDANALDEHRTSSFSIDLGG